MELEKLIPTFTDLSDWNIQVYQNTTGSRVKRIATNAAGEEFFLKGSKVLPDGSLKYPSEFWSEIVSSKIGQYLGFNMLDYNIGFQPYFIQKVGCLSKSMVTENESRLTEGKNYLVGFNPSYNPEKDKRDYTFQFIKKTLEHFKLGDQIPSLIETIVFDAIISNSDRHQENWGIIFSFQMLNDTIDEFLKTPSNSKTNKLAGKFLKWIINLMPKAEQELENHLVNKTTLNFQKSFDGLSRFSPIYDSGCCLGRELEETKVKAYLKDKLRLEGYVNKGYSEIYWQGHPKKKRHFELIELLKEDYGKFVNKHIERVKSIYKREDIEAIISTIDKNLPNDLAEFKLSEERKKLMVNILHLRVHKLFRLLS